MHPSPSNEALQAQFNEIYTIVNHSQGSKDVQALRHGVAKMHKTVELCLKLGKLDIMASGIRHVRSCVVYQTHIDAYREKRMPEAYFDELLKHFHPYENDIRQQKKNRIDIDEKLILSLIHHSTISRPEELLRAFGLAGSRKAFAILLDAHFKRSAHLDGSSTEVLPQINAYRRNARAQEALPEDIYAVLMKHPTQILAEHERYKHKQKGGFLRLDILKGLLARSSGNEIMMDVVLEMAANSLFKMSDIEHILWIEQQGIKIDPTQVIQGVTSSTADDLDCASAIYYMLLSPHCPLIKLEDAFRWGFALKSKDAYVEALRRACETYSADPQSQNEFGAKVCTLIKQTLRRSEAYGIAMLDVKGLPRQELYQDEALRDRLMLGDLGL